MNLPDNALYLNGLIKILKTEWPANRTVNIVCHGHSVPSGYFATPTVDTFNAYPHLLHVGLKQRFPNAVINVIVTAIGGENSVSGAARFEKDVLGHRPDVITIDYGLNDRGLGLEKARESWTTMIKSGKKAGVPMILLTPTLDVTQEPDYKGADKGDLQEHAGQIRELAAEHGLALADSFAASHEYIRTGDLKDILSWVNHPNRKGHDIVAAELLEWFPEGKENHA